MIAHSHTIVNANGQGCVVPDCRHPSSLRSWEVYCQWQIVEWDIVEECPWQRPQNVQSPRMPLRNEALNGPSCHAKNASVNCNNDLNASSKLAALMASSGVVGDIVIVNFREVNVIVIVNSCGVDDIVIANSCNQCP